MWAKIKQIKFSLIYLIGITILIINPLLSLNAVAKDALVSKDAVARTETKAVEAWQLVCNFGKNNQKLGCTAILEITQKIAAQTDQDKAQDRVVLLWKIGKRQNDSFVISIQTPTGIVIQPGVQLTLENQPTIVLPYVSCDRQVCSAALIMDGYALKQAAAAQKAEVVLQAVDGKAYTYSFSPKGINKAIQAINQ